MNAGQNSTTRIGRKYLNVYLILASLLSKNVSGLHEADEVSFRCLVHVPFSSTFIFDTVLYTLGPIV